MLSGMLDAQPTRPVSEFAVHTQFVEPHQAKHRLPICQKLAVLIICKDARLQKDSDLSVRNVFANSWEDERFDQLATAQQLTLCNLFWSAWITNVVFRQRRSRDLSRSDRNVRKAKAMDSRVVALTSLVCIHKKEIESGKSKRSRRWLRADSVSAFLKVKKKEEVQETTKRQQQLFT